MKDNKKNNTSVIDTLLLLYIGYLCINVGFTVDNVIFCIIGAIFMWEAIKIHKIIPYSFTAWLFGIKNKPNKKEEN